MALLDWAKFYVSKGLSVIPLEYKAKEPISKWKEYQQRLPTEEELEQWFKTAWLNIAIVCGQVSGNLVVLDFDSHESLQQFIERISDDLVKKIKKTWVVRTGKGFHIYLRVKGKPISTSFRDVGLDIQGEGKYVVAPPSLHPSGKLYEFINDPKKYDIVVLEEHEFEEILRLFKPKEEEGSNGELQKLTPLQKDQIVKLLLPYWDEGRRHFLSLMLAGALYWHNYPKEDAIATIEEICQKAKDDEVKDRIRAVEDTYSRADKANIAYKTWLQEAGIRGDEYEKLVFQLLDIIKGSFIVGNGKLAVRKSHNTLIVADFNKCIIKELRVKKDNTIVLADTIATAIPNKVVVIQTEDSEILKVSFRTPEGFVLTFEGDVEEISSQLKKNTVRVTARRKIEDALSLIISKMIQIDWCDVVRGECVKGLVLNNGKVIAIDYDISVPDPTSLSGR